MNNEITYILRGLLLFILLFATTVVFTFVGSIESDPPKEEMAVVETVSPRTRTLSAIAIKGKELFKANCASCHALNKSLSGPGLAGVEMRWPSKKLLYMWINNWEKAVATGDPYANAVKDFSPSAMSKFNFSDDEIDSILAYINESSGTQSGYAEVAKQ